ncbi:MAG TPA: glycosyltransferase [Streptosporangiaceae bacterium]|nr:glycosyltransferase [Streptosporangiaceae bacterium]
MISVLCPSRGRPAQLDASVTSLAANAAYDPPFEVLVVADDDDQDTIAAARELGPSCRLLITSRKGYDRLHEYYKIAAAAARGDWLMVWNDDAVMATLNWNAIIEGLPPGILVADVGSTQSPLCCFPAVRREAVTALGRFSTDNPHVDTFWGDAGRAAGVIAAVPVFASHVSAIRYGQHHGFYDPPHQAEIAAAAGTLRSLAVRDAS